MTVFQNVFTRLSNISYVTNYRYTYVNRISTSALQFIPKLSVEEKLGIRPRPKRPNTPFLRFIVQNRSNVAQQNPQAKPKDVVKMLAEEWKKVDESIKTQMQEDYRKEWLQYVQDSKEYDKLLSPIDKEEIEKAKNEAKSDKEKKALKKKKEELGCPKKPCSSYVYFMKSKLPERGDKPYSEFQKQVIEEWEKMPELQKDRFEKLYQKDMEEYRQKMALWTKKMNEEGLFIDQKKEKAAAPKRPGSSFVYFMRSKLSQRGEIPFKEFQKQIKDEWGKLPADEKRKFEDMYKKDLEEYKMKMLEWNKHKQIKPGVRRQ